MGKVLKPDEGWGCDFCCVPNIKFKVNKRSFEWGPTLYDYGGDTYTLRRCPKCGQDFLWYGYERWEMDGDIAYDEVGRIERAEAERLVQLCAGSARDRNAARLMMNLIKSRRYLSNWPGSGYSYFLRWKLPEQEVPEGVEDRLEWLERHGSLDEGIEAYSTLLFPVSPTQS